MLKNKTATDNAEQTDVGQVQQLSRRKFFGYVGAASAIVATAVASCKKNDTPSTDSGVDLGSGDVGKLNYTYALEQLEAAFYSQVVSSFYTGATDAEKIYFTDIRNHEVAHREFFKAAITA